MKIRDLLVRVCDKANFDSIEDYVDFCRRYLDYIEVSLQARIVSRNEPWYQFFQYKEDGGHQVTRPINTRLMYGAGDSHKVDAQFVWLLSHIRDPEVDSIENREILNRSIYTIQQSIGAALDALPQGQSNTARKLNGDLFERLIRLVINRVGVECTSGNVGVPVIVDGVEECKMSFQHDLVVKDGEVVKLLGSVKTSSKDRLGKIFVDKFLLERLTDEAVAVVAIFLNDVQRKGSDPRKLGISATFLPGHFKGYTLKLNPLDGVYYFDMRPNMLHEPLLKKHIHTFDRFLFKDLWRLASKQGLVASVDDEEPAG